MTGGGRALGELDLSSAPPALIEALRDEDLELRRLAAHSLGEIEDPAAVPGLAELLKGSDVQTARVAIWALGEIDDPAAYRVLVEALEHQDPERIESDEMIRPLLARLEDADGCVRGMAARLLGRTRHPDAGVRRAAAIALGSILE